MVYGRILIKYYIEKNEVSLRWNKLISENGGVLPITLTTHVALKDNILIFQTELENDPAHF